MQYHVTEDGPKPCQATIKSCKYAENGVMPEHYDNIKDANEAYEAFMTPQQFSKMKKFSMNLSEGTKRVVETLHKHGAQPIIVGGSVRDAFLGSDSKDIDIEVFGTNDDGSAYSYNDLNNFFNDDSKIRLNQTGVSFSVLKAQIGKEDFDISLPRTEKTTGVKHTDYDLDVDSRLSFEEASSRRDFTFNSMGYDPINKTLVDPHNGASDLNRKILRHVSDAFSDDSLRCLRAVNFASRFNLTMDEDTLELCQELAPTYSSLSHERVEEEFNKMFYKGDHCDKGLTLLHDMQWSREIKCLKNVKRDDFEKVGRMLNTTPKNLRKHVFNSYMLQNGYADTTKFLDSSIKNQNSINSYDNLLNSRTRGDIVRSHRMFKKHSPNVSNEDLFNSLNRLGFDQDTSFLKEEPEPPVITGKKLIDLGYNPGPEMGKIIKKAQRIQDDTGEQDFNKLLYKSLTK